MFTSNTNRKFPILSFELCADNDQIIAFYADFLFNIRVTVQFCSKIYPVYETYLHDGFSTS
jgi:hypothetical protein